MEKDEKHFTQIYRNKEEIQKVKTIGGVLFALTGLVASFFGFNVNK
jgi:Mg2+ and Co2+ transporter CorA